MNINLINIILVIGLITIFLEFKLWKNNYIYILIILGLLFSITNSNL